MVARYFEYESSRPASWRSDEVWCSCFICGRFTWMPYSRFCQKHMYLRHLEDW